MNDDWLYLIALKKIPLVGDITARKLLTHFGSAQRIFAQSREKLEKLIGIGSKIADNLLHSATYLHEAEAELSFAEQHHIQVIAYTDPQYPTLLKQCPDSPILFYQKGNIQLSNKRIISIVGTRNSTPYGNAFCEKLIEELAPLGVVVVSGFAYGIDINAHRQALDNGFETVAVLAHGLDTLYPHAHRDTAKQMLNQGGLLTEYTTHTNADKQNFVRRNRIVAGMSDACIVVESASHGGALITARLATEYNRDVFAFPGAVGAAYSEGCNNLIRDNKAALITSAFDFVNAMGWQDNMLNRARNEGIERQLFPELSSEEQQIMTVLQRENDLQINLLTLKTNLPIARLTALLFTLEMKGVVKALPGGSYHLLG